MKTVRDEMAVGYYLWREVRYSHERQSGGCLDLYEIRDRRSGARYYLARFFVRQIHYVAGRRKIQKWNIATKSFLQNFFFT